MNLATALRLCSVALLAAACTAECVESPDSYIETGAAAAFGPHLWRALTGPGGGTSVRAQELVQRAATNESYVLSVLTFSSSVGSGGKHCDHAAKNTLTFSGAHGDCGCGWPGRLARGLSRLIPRGNFFVNNLAMHGHGPFEGILPRLSTNNPPGYSSEGTIVVLDYSAVTHRREDKKLGPGGSDMVDEVVLRRLLALPGDPVVITLWLPPMAADWWQVIDFGSRAQTERWATAENETMRTVHHYKQPFLSMLRVTAAAVDASVEVRTLPCVRESFGDKPWEVHPEVCVHTLAAEVVLEFLSSAGPAQQVAASSSRQALPPSLKLGECFIDRPGTHRLISKQAAMICSGLSPPVSELWFERPSKAQAIAPLGRSLACENREPVFVGGKHGGQNDLKDGFFNIPASCVPVSGSDSPHEVPIFRDMLECYGFGNGSCAPTKSPGWVLTSGKRQNYGWITCGDRDGDGGGDGGGGSAAGLGSSSSAERAAPAALASAPAPVGCGLGHGCRRKADPAADGVDRGSVLAFAMECGVANSEEPMRGSLLVSWLRSYTSNWGIVNVRVVSGDELLGTARIDSRNEAIHDTLSEVTQVHVRVPLALAAGDGLVVGGLTKFPVNVTVEHVVRPAGSAPGKFPPPNSVDQRCPGKFKLERLECI